MSKSFAEALKQDLSQVEFILKMEKMAPHRKPKRVGYKPAYGTLYALRNTRMSIREGALRKVQIIISYIKINGERKKYIVCPYSYRYRKLKQGVRKL